MKYYCVYSFTTNESLQTYLILMEVIITCICMYWTFGLSGKQEKCTRMKLGYYCYNETMYWYCDNNGYGTYLRCSPNTICQCNYSIDIPCFYQNQSYSICSLNNSNDYSHSVTKNEK